MNIIFGDPSKVTDKCTVLELDTFKSPSGDQVMTAYCVLEMIPLEEMTTAANWLQIPADLMQAYHQRHWNYCKQAIEGLKGKWNGEVELTRDEYIKEWLETTHQYSYMFYKNARPQALLTFQLMLSDLAGKEWDSKEAV